MLLIILLVGCAQARPSPQRAEFICWSKDLERFAWLWKDEAQRRLPGALVLVTHGAAMSPPNGKEQWVITADPELLGKFLQQAFPNRPIVFASCNQRGDELHVAGVWYAKQNVWNPPDRYWFTPRDRAKQPGVGSIDEFIEGKP
ncbi:hypothetical protein BH09PLA1_BH09PLA1_25910 [soil metagenome]